MVPQDVQDRIVGLRKEGLLWREIADKLNVMRVPTGRGGRQWYGSTARKVALRGSRCALCGCDLHDPFAAPSSTDPDAAEAGVKRRAQLRLEREEFPERFDRQGRRR